MYEASRRIIIINIRRLKSERESERRRYYTNLKQTSDLRARKIVVFRTDRKIFETMKNIELDPVYCDGISDFHLSGIFVRWVLYMCARDYKPTE